MSAVTTYSIHYLNYRQDGLHYGTDVIAPHETGDTFKRPTLYFYERDLSPDNPVRNYAKESGDIWLRKDVALATGDEPAVWSLDLYGSDIVSVYAVTTNTERNDDLLRKTAEHHVAKKIDDLQHDLTHWRTHKQALNRAGKPTRTVYIHEIALTASGFRCKTERIVAAVDAEGMLEHPLFLTVSRPDGRRKRKRQLDDPKTFDNPTVYIDNAKRNEEKIHVVFLTDNPEIDPMILDHSRRRLLETVERLLYDRHNRNITSRFTPRYFRAFSDMLYHAHRDIAGTNDPEAVCDAIGHHWVTYSVPTSLFGGTNEIEQAGTCIRCGHDTHK